MSFEHVAAALVSLLGPEEALEYTEHELRQLQDAGYTTLARLRGASRGGLRDAKLKPGIVDQIINAQGGRSGGIQSNKKHMTKRPDTVFAVRFSVFNQFRARSALYDRMVQGGLSGYVRRINKQEVQCLAVAPIDNESAFDAFLKYVATYAPEATQRDQIKEEPASVFDDKQFPLDSTVSKDEWAMSFLGRVKVLKLSGTLKRQYVGAGSEASEDPDDAVSTHSSLQRADRFEAR